MYPGTPIENKLGCNWGCIEINWGFGGLHCVVPCAVLALPKMVGKLLITA